MADGLADINAAIAKLQDQAAASATSEDVEDINSTLEGIETDLDDLLASNNIFTGDLVINSEATLEFAENLRNRIDKEGLFNHDFLFLFSSREKRKKSNYQTSHILLSPNGDP